MGSKIDEARLCFDKIKYYYEHAGIAGYDQAEMYYKKISELAQSASRSKKYKCDVECITEIRKNAAPLMKKMKELKE
ncbi:MAG: hypothetical protein KAT04_15330 [Methylococcales bacterium]|nr:hypothetical protein [Methylococcales bacterium]